MSDIIIFEVDAQQVEVRLEGETNYPEIMDSLRGEVQADERHDR